MANVIGFSALIALILLIGGYIGWTIRDTRAERDQFAAEAARDDATDRALGIHRCSEIGNAFGGYNCVCGRPWLDSLGGCLVAPREEER